MPMRALLVTTLLLLTVVAVAGVAGARPVPPVDQSCIGKPGIANACLTVEPQGTCAGVGVGLQGAWACAGAQGPVRVCTSMYTALYGYCPTDLVAT